MSRYGLLDLASLAEAVYVEISHTVRLRGGAGLGLCRRRDLDPTQEVDAALTVLQTQGRIVAYQRKWSTTSAAVSAL